MEEITAALVKNLLPRRRQDGHKGSFGRVYVYGGSVGYTGAPVFAGEAAVRTGSGLVFVGVPGEAYPVAAARCACAMAHPAPADYGELLERVSACGAVLIGPGLGRSPETDKTVRRLLEDCRAPVVLDADGINAISAHIDVLDRRRGRPEGGETVLTPHEGEFLRLGGDLSLGRERAAADFARRHGCVLVLKGPGTLVAGPEGRLLRNPTGNCGMAKGGSGDVLAGMVLSLIGQGAPALEAAACAVWLHGRAGDLCARDLSEYAMTPLDLTGRLPAVFKELGF
ncbi:MAG: NAD(P)H-hydrate dehydratase [Oscillospiraceae bacterium]|jgi:NAD(P)H-hydrate epimerase|nr:NAD(P)H-hydrate dehydratase [Oscillospiraceae bacterium]